MSFKENDKLYNLREEFLKKLNKKSRKSERINKLAQMVLRKVSIQLFFHSYNSKKVVCVTGRETDGMGWSAQKEVNV